MKKKLYRCGSYIYKLPETACVFCDHCTDVFYDGLHGIYGMICDIDAMNKCQKVGYGCSEFKNTEEQEDG